MKRQEKNPSWIRMRSICSGLMVFVLMGMSPGLAFDIEVPSLEEKLENEGYSCDTVEEIEEAMISNSYIVRYFAVQLYAERLGADAVPRLKQSLEDDRLNVRIATARVLRKLGDTSGLTRMQRDFDEMTVDSFDEMQARQVILALDIGLVLAELKNRDALSLAIWTVENGPLAGQRHRAIQVLGELACQAADSDWDLVRRITETLGVIVATERNQTVRNLLFPEILGERTPAVLRDYVLSEMANSVHSTEYMRTRAIHLLEEGNP